MTLLECTVGRALCLIFLLLASSTLPAQQQDPEWPCVQVLVPEIVTAVFWPEVIDESLVGLWKQDETLSELVHRLSDLDQFGLSEQQTIADFINTIAPESRTVTLNKLADGIVTLSNQRRSRYIDGIKRYTRQQISISNQIEATLNQLVELDDKTDAQSIASKAEIEETLHWHQRIYDRREHALQSLCERPVELEEILSQVLRELAQHLP